jgi:hypothetical protein
MDILENQIKKDIADVLGLNDEDGTYFYALTRVKEAFNIGTMTLDDFEEVDENLVEDIYESIKPYMNVTVNTPPLPDSEMIRYLQNQINALQVEIHNMRNNQFNYRTSGNK